MVEQTIKCPECGKEFQLDAAFREHFAEEKRQAVADAVDRTSERVSAETEQHLRQEMVQQGADLKKAQDQLAAKDVAHKAALDSVKKEAEDSATERMQQQMAQQDADINKAQDELAAERENRQADLDSAVKKAKGEAEDQFNSQLEENNVEKRRMQKIIDDLQRQARQGPVEQQGEALEEWLQKTLQYTFSQDNIVEVKKGHRGADIIQQVTNRLGQRCGTIIWETKNAQSWSKNWLDKIHGDAERVNADLKVIVSAATPEGIKSFGLEDGVWVSNIESAPALALVLRQHMFQLYNLRRANIGREGKMEAVYDYLVSDRFADRVQRIVGTWKALEIQIDSEERAMQRQWKERRKQINVMIDVTTDMYTDISAVIGADEMPQVEGLSLAALPSGQDEN